MSTRKYVGGDFGLSKALFAAFLVSWVVQGIAQAELGEWGWDFVAATAENWQSEFLQLFSFVVLATFLIHRGSPQSRDGDDDVVARLERIEAKLDGSG